MASNKGRRIVDALDDLTAEIRTANRLTALSLGASALDIDKGERNKNDAAKARTARMNKLRAEIRTGLGIDEEQGS